MLRAAQKGGVMDTNTIWIIVGVLALLIVVGLIAWGMSQQRRGEEMRRRFGPEYHRTLQDTGDERRAQEVMKAREERVRALQIRSLPAADRERYAEEWRGVQARFVDDPKTALQEADRLVERVMSARGYPMGQFEQRADDISVDHPQVVDNYRQAHAISIERDRAATEDLRQAMVHYRALFEDLLEVHEPAARR